MKRGGRLGAMTTLPRGLARVPGVYRQHEVEALKVENPELHVVDAGTSPDGEPLVAVFKPPVQQQCGPPPVISLEIALPDESGRLVVLYCDVCRRWGRRRSSHICGKNWHQHLEALVQEIAQEGWATR